MTDSRKQRNEKTRYFAWMRWLLGASIFVMIFVWIMREGALLANLKPSVVAWSTLASVVTNLLQTFGLQSLGKAYGRPLRYANALHITALGSLGNSAGGLPLGTALKFTILRERAGLKIGQITWVLVMFTIGITIWLLLFAAISAQGLNVAAWVKAVPASMILVILVALAIALPWLGQRATLKTMLPPLLQPRWLLSALAISLLITLSFIANSCLVSAMILPEFKVAELIFISASGILVSLASLLQSVGGMLELGMAFAAYVMGEKPVDGAQIGLVMRATSILSSMLILGLLYVRRSYRRNDNAEDRH